MCGYKDEDEKKDRWEEKVIWTRAKGSRVYFSTIKDFVFSSLSCRFVTLKFENDTQSCLPEFMLHVDAAFCWMHEIILNLLSAINSWG